ncbi:hypothetical protein RND71_028204 [Anisodus tanguticus]|uniref:Uncharacterized protein n=1 Tax=Anisodus tanguticus TaxID=243964 RepID=A0AAE1RKG0_9SOLA|nr:hypothetical protein RND71_028204 [Anisodus tanguticus]
MGNEQLYHHIRNGSSSFFLPMLCKLSIKDVKLNNSKDPSSSNSNHTEPTSPKVSCMGQVKRNNRVIGFPTPYRPNSSTAITGPILNPKVKYTKLKKLFSGKNFTDREVLKRSVTVVNSRKSSQVNDRESSKIEVNVSELDPPLPVVKKVKSPPVDGGLWKRRSGGAALKNLQIQQIHLSTDNNLLQPTTV